jgi:glycosyltransferase involved in cell wall biosynthesis
MSDPFSDTLDGTPSPHIREVRLGLQQRVLPAYRIPFFDALAKACPKGLSVFAGQARPEELIETGGGIFPFQHAQYFPAHNRHIFRGSFYLCWQSNLLDWLEQWQPGALILEANPRYLRTPAAVRWMKGRGPVLGWGLGAPQISGPLASLRQANRKRFLGQFDALIAYSQQGADQYAAAGFPQERIFVARNAVASRPAHPPPQRPDTFASGRACLLFVGRLQARKRVDLLLRACAALPAEIQPRLIVVGEGAELGD